MPGLCTVLIGTVLTGPIQLIVIVWPVFPI